MSWKKKSMGTEEYMVYAEIEICFAVLWSTSMEYARCFRNYANILNTHILPAMINLYIVALLIWSVWHILQPGAFPCVK